jgi:hypothetical protein
VTPADLARARELHAALADGSARPEVVAELVRLLPAVFEAAEAPGLCDIELAFVRWCPVVPNGDSTVMHVRIALRDAFFAGALDGRTR